MLTCCRIFAALGGYACNLSYINSHPDRCILLVHNSGSGCGNLHVRDMQHYLHALAWLMREWACHTMELYIIRPPGAACFALLSTLLHHYQWHICWHFLVWPGLEMEDCCHLLPMQGCCW